MSEKFINTLPFVIAGLAVWALVFFRAKKQEKRYDERQLLARNAAFKTAFFTLAGYCVVCAFLNMLGINWALTATQMFLGVILSIGVFACICLYRDAFFDFAKKNQKLYIFEMMAFSVIQFIGGVGMLHGQPIWGEEGLSIVSIVFATALCFFAVGVTAAIKTYTDARQED